MGWYDLLWGKELWFANGDYKFSIGLNMVLFIYLDVFTGSQSEEMIRD